MPSRIANMSSNTSTFLPHLKNQTLVDSSLSAAHTIFWLVSSGFSLACTCSKWNFFRISRKYFLKLHCIHFFTLSFVLEIGVFQMASVSIASWHSYVTRTYKLAQLVHHFCVCGQGNKILVFIGLCQFAASLRLARHWHVAEISSILSNETSQCRCLFREFRSPLVEMQQGDNPSPPVQPRAQSGDLGMTSYDQNHNRLRSQ